MFGYRFFKKTKGAISIFMVIVLFCMVTFTGIVIDASRIRAGESEIDSSTDVALNAVMAKYNMQLKEYFGLMGLSESDEKKLMEDFSYYMNRTLMVKGLKDDKAMSNDSWEKFQKLLGTGDEKKGKGYVDMFGFKPESTEISTLYNLSEPNVLRNQIVDYVKFRGPKSLGEEVVDKINALKGYQKQTEMYEKKLDLDEETSDLSDNIEDLGKLFKEVNKVGGKKKLVETHIDAIITSLEKKIAVEKKISEMEKPKPSSSPDSNASASPPATDKPAVSPNTLGDSLEGKSLDELKKMRTDLGKKIEEAFNGGSDSKGNHIDGLIEITNKGISCNDLNNIKSKIKDIKEAKKNLDTKSKKLMNDLKGDESEFAIKMKDELEDYKKKLADESLDTLYDKVDANYKMLQSGTKSQIKISDFNQSVGYINELKKVKEQIDKIDYSKLNYKYDDMENIKKHVASVYIKKEHMYIDYFDKYQLISPSEFPGIDEVDKKDIQDPRDFGKEAVNGDKNPINDSGTEDKKDGETEAKGLPEDLPSKKSVSSDSKLEKFKKEDDEQSKYLKEGGASKENGDEKELDSKVGEADFEDSGFAKNSIGKIKQLFSMLEKGAETSRDELYVGEYAMGNFSNNLTKNEENDLRGVLKETRPKYLKNEVEYILGGSENENTNLNTVKSEILLTRFALNVLYIYTDKAKQAQTLAAATAICSSFMGVGAIAIKVVQNLMLLSWAMAESVYDLNQIMKGRDMVLFKTSNTWVLSVEGLVGEASMNIKNELTSKFKEKIDTTLDSATEKAFTLGKDKASDVSTQTMQRVNDMIGERIDIALDRVMKPVEDAIHTRSKQLGDDVTKIEEETDKKVQSELEQIDNDLFKDAVNEIYTYAKEEKLGQDKVNELLNMPRDKALFALENLKTVAKVKISGKISGITKKLKNKVDDAVEKASDKAQEKVDGSIDNATGKAYKKADEQLNKFINSMGNGSNGVATKGLNTKSNVKSSMVTFGYKDYLRIFLLVMPRNKKVLRIADLVQLDMNEMGNSNFKMADTNTYLRVKSEVSMRYLFMTSGIMPESLRTKSGNHKIKVITYKGY